MFDSRLLERSGRTLLALALAVSGSGRAAAQTAPKMNLATPAPAPPEGREYHLHEGFYTRVGVGMGGLFNSKSSGSFSSNTGGMSLSFELLIGGSPAPGFAIGGGVLGGVQLTGTWDVNEGDGLENVDVNANGNLLTLVIGPFVDGFPGAAGPFHLGGAVGLGVGSVSVQDERRTPLGVGGAFWAGWDVWVAPEWSLGGRLRLDGMYGKDGEVNASSVGASVMFSVLYH
jgi:hypothetical protein